MSREEIRDATETRILIECEALRRSMRDGDDDWEAESSPPSMRSAFRSSGSRVSGKVQPRTCYAMGERHHAFHRALIAHCGSPRLLELADRLYIETERYRLPCLIGGVAGKPRRDVAAEHQQIMDATLRRSEDAGRISPNIIGGRPRSSKRRSTGPRSRKAAARRNKDARCLKNFRSAAAIGRSADASWNIAPKPGIIGLCCSKPRYAR